MSTLQILLLEDDPNLGFILQEHLELQGYGVDLQTNGVDGMEHFRKGGYALCLVDVMMPKKDGFTFAREFRGRDKDTPLIFLTARSLKEDRIEGFRSGGDDYITKPFSMEELLLRIQAVLRRTAPSEPAPAAASVFTIGKFRFDPRKQTLQSGSTKQPLTAKESEVMELLCARKNTLVARNDILKLIWGDDSYFNGRSLDVFISKLRKHLASDRSIEIKNVHGKGYKLTTKN